MNEPISITCAACAFEYKIDFDINFFFSPEEIETIEAAKPARAIRLPLNPPRRCPECALRLLALDFTASSGAIILNAVFADFETDNSGGVFYKGAYWPNLSGYGSPTSDYKILDTKTAAFNSGELVTVVIDASYGDHFNLWKAYRGFFDRSDNKDIDDRALTVAALGNKLLNQAELVELFPEYDIKIYGYA